MRELKGGGTQCSGATKLKNVSIEEAGEKLMKIIFPNHFDRKPLKKY